MSLPASKEVEKAVEKAVESLKPATPADTAPAEAAAEKAAGISSNWVFLLGLGLLSLFVVYFAAESARRKRIVGTILSISVAALCVWLYQGLGMEKGIELQGGISMEIKIQPKPGQEVSADAQQQAIGVLTKRLNDLGTADVLIAPSGTAGSVMPASGITSTSLRTATRQNASVPVAMRRGTWSLASAMSVSPALAPAEVNAVMGSIRMNTRVLEVSWYSNFEASTTLPAAAIACCRIGVPATAPLAHSNSGLERIPPTAVTTTQPTKPTRSGFMPANSQLTSG